MIKPRKLANGKTRYDARVKVKGSPVSKSFDSRTEAQKWVNRTRALRDQDKPIMSQPVNVQEMFDAYLDHAEEKGKSCGTLKGNKARFRNYILPGYGPQLDMTTVSLEEHQLFFSMLKKKGVKPATRNRIRSLVRVMHSVAIKYRLFDGAFKENPFDYIEPAIELKKKIEYWTQEEMDKFLAFHTGSHYFPLFLLLLKTGLRIGEALGIHSEQIDWTSQILTVDRQFDRAENRIVPRTKSRKIRHVHLVCELMEALPRKDGPLFTKEDKTFLTPDYFTKKIFPKACRKAQVKEITPHSTRHTFASHFLMNGGSLWDLSKILGHSSTAVTEERYGHFDIKHVKERMRVVERKDNLVRANFG